VCNAPPNSTCESSILDACFTEAKDKTLCHDCVQENYESIRSGCSSESLDVLCPTAAPAPGPANGDGDAGDGDAGDGDGDGDDNGDANVGDGDGEGDGAAAPTPVPSEGYEGLPLDVPTEAPTMAAITHEGSFFRVEQTVSMVGVTSGDFSSSCAITALSTLLQASEDEFYVIGVQEREQSSLAFTYAMESSIMQDVDDAAAKAGGLSSPLSSSTTLTDFTNFYNDCSEAAGSEVNADLAATEATEPLKQFVTAVPTHMPTVEGEIEADVAVMLTMSGTFVTDAAVDVTGFNASTMPRHQLAECLGVIIRTDTANLVLTGVYDSDYDSAMVEYTVATKSNETALQAYKAMAELHNPETGSDFLSKLTNFFMHLLTDSGVTVPDNLAILNPRFPTMELLTPSPTISPTPVPTKYLTDIPTSSPSEEPSFAPTKWDETPSPTILRTHMPTTTPTAAPTTRAPTNSPTYMPTWAPTKSPTPSVKLAALLAPAVPKPLIVENKTAKPLFKLAATVDVTEFNCNNFPEDLFLPVLAAEIGMDEHEIMETTCEDICFNAATLPVERGQDGTLRVRKAERGSDGGKDNECASGGIMFDYSVVTDDIEVAADAKNNVDLLALDEGEAMTDKFTLDFRNRLNELGETYHPKMKVGYPSMAKIAIQTPAPTFSPTYLPTHTPTGTPTGMPTATPSTMPTGAPSPAPTGTPTPAPTSTPTKTPTVAPIFVMHSEIVLTGYDNRTLPALYFQQTLASQFQISDASVVIDNKVDRQYADTKAVSIEYTIVVSTNESVYRCYENALELLNPKQQTPLLEKFIGFFKLLIRTTGGLIPDPCDLREPGIPIVRVVSPAPTPVIPTLNPTPAPPTPAPTKTAVRRDAIYTVSTCVTFGAGFASADAMSPKDKGMVEAAIAKRVADATDGAVSVEIKTIAGEVTGPATGGPASGSNAELLRRHRMLEGTDVDVTVAVTMDELTHEEAIAVSKALADGDMAVFTETLVSEYTLAANVPPPGIMATSICDPQTSTNGASGTDTDISVHYLEQRVYLAGAGDDDTKKGVSETAALASLADYLASPKGSLSVEQNADDADGETSFTYTFLAHGQDQLDSAKEKAYALSNTNSAAASLEAYTTLYVKYLSEAGHGQGTLDAIRADTPVITISAPQNTPAPVPYTGPPTVAPTQKPSMWRVSWAMNLGGLPENQLDLKVVMHSLSAMATGQTDLSSVKLSFGQERDATVLPIDQYETNSVLTGYGYYEDSEGDADSAGGKTTGDGDTAYYYEGLPDDPGVLRRDRKHRRLKSAADEDALEAALTMDDDADTAVDATPDAAAVGDAAGESPEEASALRDAASDTAQAAVEAAESASGIKMPHPSAPANGDGASNPAPVDIKPISAASAISIQPMSTAAADDDTGADTGADDDTGASYGGASGDDDAGDGEAGSYDTATADATGTSDTGIKFFLEATSPLEDVASELKELLHKLSVDPGTAQTFETEYGEAHLAEGLGLANIHVFLSTDPLLERISADTPRPCDDRTDECDSKSTICVNTEGVGVAAAGGDDDEVVSADATVDSSYGDNDGGSYSNGEISFLRRKSRRLSSGSNYECQCKHGFGEGPDFRECIYDPDGQSVDYAVRASVEFTGYNNASFPTEDFIDAILNTIVTGTSRTGPVEQGQHFYVEIDQMVDAGNVRRPFLDLAYSAHTDTDTAMMSIRNLFKDISNYHEEILDRMDGNFKIKGELMPMDFDIRHSSFDDVYVGSRYNFTKNMEERAFVDAPTIPPTSEPTKGPTALGHADPSSVAFGLDVQAADGTGISADVLSNVLARMTGGFGGGNISASAPAATEIPEDVTVAGATPVAESDETAALEASIAADMLGSVGGDGKFSSLVH
jgi:hypothetical protein